MKLIWIRKGLAVARKDLLIDCDRCPCSSGFKGWENPDNRYLFYEFRDWDCCLMDKNVYVSEGGFSKVDGHVTFQWFSFTECTVAESTGYYTSQYPVGTMIPLNTYDGYPSPFVMTSTVINDTIRLDATRNPYCCNADGMRIYAVMFDNNEEFE